MSMEVTAWNAMYNARLSYNVASPGTTAEEKAGMSWSIARKHCDYAQSHPIH